MNKNITPETDVETFPSTSFTVAVVAGSTTALVAGVALLNRYMKKKESKPDYELIGLFDKLETDYITV